MQADHLATEVAAIPADNVINHVPSPMEIIASYKVKWTETVLNYLSTHGNGYSSLCPKLGILDWHHHKDRHMSTSLHKLRTGHNRLRAFLNRLDAFQDPLCRFGCEDIEDVHHILLDCKEFSEPRSTLKQFFISKKLTWDLATIRGLNHDLDRSTQLDIRGKLVSFLSTSRIPSLL
jgi:hypothetical protein